FELKFHLIPKLAVSALGERICKQGYIRIKVPHLFYDPGRDTGSYKELPIRVSGETAEQMSGLPRMNQYLCIKRRIANASGEPAMVLMRVGNDYPADIGKLDAVLSQPRSQCGLRLGRFRTDIDKSNRVLSDEVN